MPRWRQQGHVGGGTGDEGAAPVSVNVLSRVAERVYWLGRYLERAESTARLVTVNANLIMDLPVRLPLGWRPLIDITGSGDLFESLYGKGHATERNVCRFLATDTRNPGSIINSIIGVRDNARTVRENMPRITFEYINELYLFARSALVPGQSRSRRGDALTRISRLAQQLEGFLSQNMLHDAHWELMRLGNFIERADMTTRIIDVRTVDLIAGGHELLPFQDIQWRSVLRSFYAMQSYHASVREPVDPPLVLEFLFKDERLPRSYLRCLNSVRRSLRELPRNGAAVDACDAALSALKETDVKHLGGLEHSADLHAFINACQIRLGKLHGAIAETYFT
ncbi:MAG: alpha-E domain-containing protein [Gammaproteobacteria bacterium]|nr:alpha-E domain-containing protein [Gammaproteobacteria bacterium]